MENVWTSGRRPAREGSHEGGHGHFRPVGSPCVEKNPPAFGVPLEMIVRTAEYAPLVFLRIRPARK